MERKGATYALAITLMTLGVPPAAGSAPTINKVPIILQVGGEVALPPQVVERARRIVARIYSRAGTQVVWRSIGSDRTDATAGFPVFVMIRREWDNTIPQSVLGFAPDTSGRLAYVLYHHVTAFADAKQLDLGQLLGHVIAHEVGHLLLPPGAHSQIGLMCATLNVKTLRRGADGQIGFTANQVRQIQARLAAVEDRQAFADPPSEWQFP